MRIAKAFTFEAAHFLPTVPLTHQCSRIHGHSYRVEVVIDGPIDRELGWVLDFGVLSDAWKRTGGRFDHSLLNDDLTIPTAENLALRIAADMTEELVTFSGNVVEVTVWETATSRATWRVEQ